MIITIPFQRGDLVKVYTLTKSEFAFIDDADERNGSITTSFVTNKRLKQTITDLSRFATTNLVSLQFVTRNTDGQMIVDVYTPCHQPQFQANITVQYANTMKEALWFSYVKGKSHPLAIFYIHQINQKAY